MLDDDNAGKILKADHKILTLCLW